MVDSRGVFVLSLDTEVAWGTFDHGGLIQYRHHFDQIRPIVRQLVELLDRWQVPATWAFVGHLLLRDCTKQEDGLAHPDVLRPRYRWYPHDWHHLDPGTDVERDPWWYGPDLVDMVRTAAVGHEIGSHTFSHVVAGDPACTPDILRSQLSACLKLHSELGIDLTSLVYPRNKVAHVDLLADLGFTAYRGAEQRWYTGANPKLRKLFHLLDAAVGLTPTTYGLDELAGELPINIPASMFYLQRDGVRRLIPIKSRVRQARAGLSRAAARGELFHLWFHPFNLGSDPALFDGLDAILGYADELRSRGALSILTMREAAELVAGHA